MKNTFLKIPFLIFFLLLTCFSKSQIIIDFQKSEQSLRLILANQEKAWNNGDLNDYMQGYWNHDSLKFIGKSGIQYGWKKTLDNYKKSYPEKASMGILKFDIMSVDFLSETSAFVIGKWALTRDKGNISGYFTLLFKNINKKWLIVCDHSS